MIESKVAGRTRSSLLDAAEELFARRGFAGASVRAITAAAGCDLGSVRYHFGSKASLFAAVLRRGIEPVCRERLRRLSELESPEQESPRLEPILEAFVRPAVEALCDPASGERWARLAAWARVDPAAFAVPGAELLTEVNAGYARALERALPALPAEEVACRFFFLFGAQVNTLIDAVRLPGVSLPDFCADPDRLVARLVQFGAAGMREPHPAPTS